MKNLALLFAAVFGLSMSLGGPLPVADASFSSGASIRCSAVSAEDALAQSKKKKKKDKKDGGRKGEESEEEYRGAGLVEV